MNIFASIAGLFGLALLTGLTAYYGFAPGNQAIESSGWGTVLVIMARAVALAGRVPVGGFSSRRQCAGRPFLLACGLFARQ